MPTAPTAPTGLPAAPDPADRTTFNARAYPWASALPAFGTQLTAVASNAFNNATEAAASAGAASGYVGTVAASAAAAAQSVEDAAAQVALAQSSATMKGAWSGLTGALSKPASVAHSGKIWVLLNNLTNVATSQPGVSADWFDVTPSKSAYSCLQEISVITLPVGTAPSILVSRLTVDSSRELLFFYSDTAIQAVVYDNSTKAYGPPVLVRIGASISVSATLVGLGKVLVSSAPASSTAFQAVVLSLTGTAIAVGASAASVLPEAISSSFRSIYSSPVTVGSSYVFGVRLASSQRLIAITVSGTTPTIGVSLNLYASSGMVPSIRPIDSTRLLAVYYSGTTLSAVPVTVSAGTTLSAGTSASTAGAYLRYLTVLASGRWAMVYANTNTFGAVISVSGTVAAITTAQLTTTGDTAAGSIVKFGNQLLVQCTTTSANVLTDVSGTATPGVSVTLSGAASQAAIAYGTDYVVLGGVGLFHVIKISGNSPVVSYLQFAGSSVLTTGVQMSSGGPPDDGPPIGVLSLAGKSVLPIAGGSASHALLFSASALSVIPTIPSIAYPYGWAVSMQSPSVAWSAAQSASGTGILVSRLEMV